MTDEEKSAGVNFISHDKNRETVVLSVVECDYGHEYRFVIMEKLGMAGLRFQCSLSRDEMKRLRSVLNGFGE